MQVKLALMPLILLMAILASGDNRLSSEFQAPARSYLQSLRECSNGTLQKENPPPCANDEARNKTTSAATTPGDKTVLSTLKSWDDNLTNYAMWISLSKPNAEQKSKERSKLQHQVEVCSAELERTLKAGVAPDKSECDEVLK